MRTTILAVVVAIVCIARPVSAQEDWTPPDSVWLFSVGASVYGAMTMHSGSFVLPNAPTCCTEYTSATGFGPAASVFLRQEFTKAFRLSLRGSYIPMNGSFTTDEQLLLTGQVAGVSQHSLDVKMGWMGAELMADVRLVGPLRLLAGYGIGTMLSPTFSQKETLIEPSTGTFENGRRVRNESTDQELTGLAQWHGGVVGGLSYDVPLTRNNSIILTPEVTYRIGLGNIVDGFSWKANTLRLGASIAFAVNAATPPKPVIRRRELSVDSTMVSVEPDQQYRRTEGREASFVDTTETADTIFYTTKTSRTDTVFTPVLPTIHAAIAAKAVEPNGTLNNVFGIAVSTQFVTEALPLLPVIFFESQSISLSFRYRQIKRPSEFSVDAIPPRTTEVHHEVLNILGSRLQNNPTAKVRLRGTADPTTEGADCELARKRAEAVKNYLTSVWSISADRIEVVTATGSCAPERATRQPSEEGYSENRRVEIETSDLDLLASVGRKRFNEARAVTPPRLLFDPTGSSTQFVTGWRLEAKSGQNVLFAKSGTGTPASVTQDLSTNQADQMQAGMPVVVTLHLDAIRGVHDSAITTLSVRKDTISTEMERLTLTLFEVASDKLTPIAEEQIKKFVDQVPAGSTVSVRGYADMLGNAEFNKKISARRAEAVCAAIQRHLSRRVTLKCDEVTTDRFPPGIDSYATPEERFLSRTVQIEVKRQR